MRRVATRVADRWIGMGAGALLFFGLLDLVLVEPAFEEADGGEEVVVEGEEQVDVVEVSCKRSSGQGCCVG